MIDIVYIEDSDDDAKEFAANINPHWTLKRFDDLEKFLKSGICAKCIVTDLRLVKHFGNEIITAIRAAHPQTPLIVLTGAAEKYLTGSIYHNMILTGADEVLTKDVIGDPFLLTVLEQHIPNHNGVKS